MGALGRIILVCTSMVITMPLSALPGSAADLSDPDQPVSTEARINAAWDVSISPFYAWVPGVNGRMGVFGQPPVKIDITPIDIIKNIDEFIDVLEGVYIGGGQITRGNLGFMWDIIYFDIRAVDQIGGDFVGGTLDVGFSATTGTLAGTYRVHESDRSHFDVLAGARITDVDLKVGVDLGLIDEISVSDGDTWIDPIIGVRGRTDLTERTYVDGWAMIGGFGVQSDFLWDVYGVVGYEFSDWLSAYAGYRGSGTDYRNGAFIWDITKYGPILGFELKFRRTERRRPGKAAVFPEPQMGA